MDSMDINRILELAGVEMLNEAISKKRVLQMFSSLYDQYPEYKESILEQIQWAMSNLQREDRVIWYLRAVQIKILQKAYAKYNDPKILKDLAKKINNWAFKSPNPRANQSQLKQISLRQLQASLMHFLSLPIDAIKSYEFQWQSPNEIIDDFFEYESIWKETREDYIEDDEAELIMDFGDGFGWYDLQKAYCSKEAKAMGHCGNSPRQHTDDTILSLRYQGDHDGQPIYRPVLTFIRNEDGYLTEMKGRGNDKPAERYHKYIVPLLKSDHVEGIIGGGYLPENNFSIYDLPEEQRDELVAEKPSLEGPFRRIRDLIEQKSYEAAQQAIEEVTSGLSINVYDWDWQNNEVLLEQYMNYERFVTVEYDNPPSELFGMLERIEDYLKDEKKAQGRQYSRIFSQKIRPDLVFDVISDISNAHVLQKLIDVASENAQMPADGYEKFDLIANMISNKATSLYDHFETAVVRVIENKENEGVVPREKLEEYKEEIVDRIQAYRYMTALKPYESYGKTEGLDLDDPFIIYLPISSYVDALEAGFHADNYGDEYYDDEGTYLYQQLVHEHVGIDEDNTNDMRAYPPQEFKGYDLQSTGDSDEVAQELEEKLGDLEGFYSSEMDINQFIEEHITEIAKEFSEVVSIKESLVFESLIDLDFINRML